MINLNRLWFFTILTLLLPLSLGNALTLFTIESDFMAVGNISSTYGFDDIPSPSVYSPGSVLLGNVIYTPDEQRQYYSYHVISGSLGFSTVTNHEMSFGQSRYVNAFGFQFRSGFNQLQPYLGHEIIVYEVDGTQTLFTGLLPNNPVVGYFGFTSNIGIHKIRVQDNPNDNNGSSFTFDNVSRSAILGGEPLQQPLSFGQDSTSNPVPEPSSLILLSSGLIGFIVRKYKS